MTTTLIPQWGLWKSQHCNAVKSQEHHKERCNLVCWGEWEEEEREREERLFPADNLIV